jgi:hypothetical protein
MYSKFFKKIVFSILIFSILSTPLLICSDAVNEQAPKNPSPELSKLKNELDTTQRIILQSIIEALWEYIKENSKNTKFTVINDNGKKYTVELTDFGKTISNLIIDETIPTPNQKISQKAAELLIPTAVAFITTKMLLNNNDKEKDYPLLTLDLATRLLIKMIMIRWFVKPSNKIYPLLNIIAYVGSFYKYDTNESGFYKFFNFNNGMVKLTQDQIKTLVDASNLGETLNKPHRKKALRKLLQTLIDPYVQWALDNIKNKTIHSTT